MNINTCTCLVLTACCFVSSGYAAELVSPFAGSEFIGEFQEDFGRFVYLSQKGDSEETVTTEGRLVSRLYRKPTNKGTFEVFRSYEKELSAAGFEMLAVIGDNKKRAQKLSRRINRDEGNRMAKRAYALQGKSIVGNPIDYIVTFTEHYIAARKTIGQTEYLVVILIADRKDAYSVDVLESAAMEENTVALNLDTLRSQMASEGRVAVYGILFDTGSANIQTDSADTLDVIAQYRKENPKRSFYVVGHTDDQGKLSGNMQLSKARAESSLKALLVKAPDAASRLSAHGVGPLSPVASNEQDKGRQLNRRVELVLTIE